MDANQTTQFLSIAPAVSALLGTLAGGLITFFTTFFLKKEEWKKDDLMKELAKRETLYGEFSSEYGRLVLKSIGSTVKNTDDFQALWGLLARIKLTASEEVITEADAMVKIALHGVSKKAESENEEQSPRSGFIGACRTELAKLRKDGLPR